jgi:adhesin HecA-like repeat protein
MMRYDGSVRSDNDATLSAGRLDNGGQE